MRATAVCLSLSLAALALRAEHKVEISAPQRGEKREIMDRALTNAREQLGRRLAENSAQTQLLEGVADTIQNNVSLMEIPMNWSTVFATLDSRAP